MSNQSDMVTIANGDDMEAGLGDYTEIDVFTEMCLAFMKYGGRTVREAQIEGILRKVFEECKITLATAGMTNIPVDVLWLDDIFTIVLAMTGDRHVANRICVPFKNQGVLE